MIQLKSWHGLGFCLQTTVPSSFRFKTKKFPDLDQWFDNYMEETGLQKNRVVSDLIAAYRELAERAGHIPLRPFELSENVPEPPNNDTKKK